LADLCDRSCARCVKEVAGELCSCTPPDVSAEARPPEIQKRWFNLPKPRCERCEFLLLIQAIEHLVPAEDLRDWLEQPNMDLDGRSPKDWIDAGDYEAVFTTLFLLDPLGPVS
jgi:Protein of unknown function (DUF2384)